MESLFGEKMIITSIQSEKESESRPWREVINGFFPDDSIPSAILRGSRFKKELTQVQLSEITGIPAQEDEENLQAQA